VKVVFMGSPGFAVPSLRAVHASTHDVVEVVTQPDRPAGRGRRVRPSAIGETATKLGLEISKPGSFRAEAFVGHLESVGADVFVVVAFGEILRRRHLEIPPRGCVNVHPSLLPRHRGPVPIVGTLLAGDDVTGVTTMRIDRGVDTGDLYLQEAVEIHAGEDAGALHDRLSELGAELLLRTLDGIEAGTLSPVPQDHERATVTGMLKKSDGLLDWEGTAIELYRRVRAMTPWPGAFTMRRALDGSEQRLTIVRAIPADDLPQRGQPGEVVDVTGDGPVIACGCGHLRVLRVKPAGSREMTGPELVRGHRVAGGERWHA
jgi:methionyl-tRNA formyltransferase